MYKKKLRESLKIKFRLNIKIFKVVFLKKIKKSIFILYETFLVDYLF